MAAIIRRIMRPRSALPYLMAAVVAAALSTGGCGSSAEPAAEDPEFEADWTEDFENDTEVSFESAAAAQVALDTCAGSAGATLVRYDSTVVPRLAYRGAEHLELWDNLLPTYADGTLPGVPW